MIPVGNRVSAPIAMDPAWVAEPSFECAKGYSDYWVRGQPTERELAQEPKGWTAWAMGSAVRSVKLPVTVASVLTGGFFTASIKSLAGNTVIDAAAETIPALYTRSTRIPIDHDRVDAAIEKLRRIQTCDNAGQFIERVQAVYKASKRTYFRSNGSDKLVLTLSNPDLSPVKKITAMIDYLNRRSLFKDYQELFYNNGKRFFQILICMTEKSTIDQSEFQ